MIEILKHSKVSINFRKILFFPIMRILIKQWFSEKQYKVFDYPLKFSAIWYEILDVWTHFVIKIKKKNEW